MIVLEVDRLPASNASRNVHWRVKQKERREWHVALMHALYRWPGFWKLKPHQPIEQARVVFIRRSAREPDSDNLPGSFKLVRDLLCVASKKNPGGLGLIVDDDPAHLLAEYRWEKAPMRQGSIRVEISSAEVDPESDEVGSQY